ncbi:hypothetical protein LPW11_08025 [Geomonas sp. RF6]|uniref:MnhB domain-containing protein n=1 Tax=Geomonas sp. RF6 TaxID=2897342 RepID=UPI001E474A93|nr:MnhB domain-containing protein [Geomonas sp. RF6]UFS72126.1 hypothetical protein LPW11_08025 [Geomonas sp. RF6]
MSGRLRVILFLAAAAAFGWGLLDALAGIPPFGDYRGPYGDVVLQTMGELRHTQQGVAAVTFDYRGFDTLGEEFILFAAVAGALLLMRRQPSEKERGAHDQAPGHPAARIGPACRVSGLIMFPFTLLLGIYVVLHGHLSPGGGFQGGVLLASAFYFVYLSGEFEDLASFVKEHPVELTESAGAAAFALLAAIPLLLGEPCMKNILPFGEKGELLSSGMLPLFNIAVGIEVGAGFLLLVHAFLKQVLLIRKEGKK